MQESSEHRLHLSLQQGELNECELSCFINFLSNCFQLPANVADNHHVIR